MMDEKRVCKRCLLADIPDEARLAQSIRELVDLLPEDKRAPAAETEQRLSTCRACDHLQNGMCTLCGCYVELRAAKRHMCCPNTPSNW